MTEFEKLIQAESYAHTIEIVETSTGKTGVMVRYSAGRMTYMPSTAADFISDNKKLISSETADKILIAVADEMDSCWINMKTCLKEKTDWRRLNGENEKRKSR